MKLASNAILEKHANLKLIGNSVAKVRGPMRAMPNTAVKPRGPLKALPNQGPLSVFKRLQSHSESNTSMADDEDLALYDEYLLSSLMLVNVQKNCKEAIKAANKELVDLCVASEQIRGQVSVFSKRDFKLNLKVLKEKIQPSKI